MRLLVETRWFTVDINGPRRDEPAPPRPNLEASGSGTYDLGYDDRIGFRAPLHDHSEAS